MYIGTDKVLELATKWHSNQKRIGGDPYITHPIRVAFNSLELLNVYIINYKLQGLLSNNGNINTIKEIVQVEPSVLTQAALLHDVLEDCPVTVDEMLDLKINPKVVDLCKILNKNNYKGYADYILQIRESPVEAIIIKYCDITDNLSGMEVISPEKSNKKDKYLLSKNILYEALYKV